MGHWRDGGIGTMLGSDDRPIEEWTLLEKLAEISNTPFGGPMPRCLLGPWDLARPLAAIAQEAFDEIQRLRGGYPADLADTMVKLRDRAAGYESLLEEPQWSPTRSHIEPDIELMREAANEIERLRGVEVNLRLTDAMPEIWRNTAVEEWGNSILGELAKFDAMRMCLDALHKDAARALPEGARYMVLIPYGKKNVMCWYRSADMDEYPTWTGHGQQQPFGYYLVGRYVTPGEPESPISTQNGGAA